MLGEFTATLFVCFLFFAQICLPKPLDFITNELSTLLGQKQTSVFKFVALKVLSPEHYSSRVVPNSVSQSEIALIFLSTVNKRTTETHNLSGGQ